MLSLNVEKRDTNTKLNTIRSQGLVPAVFYGPKVKTTPITLSAKDFEKLWKKAGESSVIILKEKDGEEHEALIHEVDRHPVTEEVRHADFYVIEKGKKVEVTVPLIFDGVSPAVKDKGGILVKVMREIDVEATPKDLPHEIKVDISRLVELEDTIHVKDLTVPAGVEFKTGAEEVVALVTEAKEEEVVQAPIDLSAIEVEAKGKEVKEGEAVPEAETKPEAK